MRPLLIGVMSGTSLDHIDSALVDFSTTRPQLCGTHQSAIPPSLRQACQKIIKNPQCSLDELCQLDRWLGETIATHILSFLEQEQIASSEIWGIGSHGQTLYHYPHPPYPSTLQIGDPNIIAAKTGITTLADFRRRDMALKGQGAPLAPGFHHALLNDEKSAQAVVNLGGIANITLLPMQGPTRGFDCGPANTLLDHLSQQHLDQAFDHLGQWARQGEVIQPLLKSMLHDPYFQQPIPKSTGREYFNAQWLTTYLEPYSTLAPQDIQRTMLELTARVITQHIQTYQPETQTVILCGGGCANEFLVERIQALCPDCDTTTTQSFGVPPQSIEAMAWAWLAYQTLHQQPGNLPSVTGATEPSILGGIYPANLTIT